jgi:hypothetical protein
MLLVLNHILQDVQEMRVAWGDMRSSARYVSRHREGFETVKSAQRVQSVHVLTYRLQSGYLSSN